MRKLVFDTYLGILLNLRLALPGMIYRNALFPDFLCVGGQKCGTSWLYQNLRKQEGVFIPNDRYLHYFDRNFRGSYRKYLENFEIGRERIKGEVIPGYGLINRKRIKFVRKCNPDLKIIFMVRNPIHRAWSHALMHFLTFENRDFKSLTEEDFINHFESNVSQQKGDYLRILGNWESVFSEENILVISYDDVCYRPAWVFKQVLIHIGIKEPTDLDTLSLHQRVNKGYDLEIPPNLEYYLEQLYDEKMRAFKSRYPLQSETW